MTHESRQSSSVELDKQEDTKTRNIFMYENKFALIRKGPTDKYHQQIKTIRNHPKLIKF